MTTVSAPIKADKKDLSHSDHYQGIEYHKKAAKNHEEAAKHHLDAARYLALGNNEKAFESTVKAHGHHSLANEAQKEVLRHYALNS